MIQTHGRAGESSASAGSAALKVNVASDASGTSAAQFFAADETPPPPIQPLLCTVALSTSELTPGDKSLLVTTGPGRLFPQKYAAPRHHGALLSPGLNL